MMMSWMYSLDKRPCLRLYSQHRTGGCWGRHVCPETDTNCCKPRYLSREDWLFAECLLSFLSNITPLDPKKRRRTLRHDIINQQIVKRNLREIERLLTSAKVMVPTITDPSPSHNQPFGSLVKVPIFRISRRGKTNWTDVICVFDLLLNPKEFHAVSQNQLELETSQDDKGSYFKRAMSFANGRGRE